MGAEKGSLLLTWEHTGEHLYSHGSIHGNTCTHMGAIRGTLLLIWEHTGEYLLYSHGSIQGNTCTHMGAYRGTLVLIWEHTGEHLYSYGSIQGNTCTHNTLTVIFPTTLVTGYHTLKIKYFCICVMFTLYCIPMYIFFILVLVLSYVGIWYHIVKNLWSFLHLMPFISFWELCKYLWHNLLLVF